MLDFLMNLDYQIFSYVNNNLTHPILDIFFFWITDLHKTIYFKVLIVPFVIFLFIKNYRRQGITLFLILILALGVNDFIGGRVKHLVARERPFNNAELNVTQRSEAGGFSFKSNHSSNMFTFATYTAQFIPQAKIPLYVIAATVAYSRVYNGVHYPSDVFAGSLFGYLWGLLAAQGAKRLLMYIKNRKKTA